MNKNNVLSKTDYCMKTGSKIREARERNKLTQNDLAELVGVDVKTISRYERGITLPDLYTFEVISQELNIPLYKLGLNGKEKKDKPSTLKKVLKMEIELSYCVDTDEISCKVIKQTKLTPTND